MKYLVTGANGFIGYHLCKKLLKLGHSVIGIDNMNSYYDRNLKSDRMESLFENEKYFCYFDDISELDSLENIIQREKIDKVIHLAAQAGVRYSLENPTEYFKSNVQGFFNILEVCRKYKLNLVYASSSSVYGDVNIVPYKETDNTDYPISFYGATKKMDEIMAFSYFKSFGVNSIGLRFFTVYGPYGRPDMAYFSFTKKILAGETIELYNNGLNKRDFTYIDDIIESITRLLYEDKKECTVYNIGNSSPITTIDFVNVLFEILDKKVDLKLVDRQNGDVLDTYAICDKLQLETNFSPQTNIKDGLIKFVSWYKKYYSV